MAIFFQLACPAGEVFRQIFQKRFRQFFCLHFSYVLVVIPIQSFHIEDAGALWILSSENSLINSSFEKISLSSPGFQPIKAIKFIIASGK